QPAHTGPAMNLEQRLIEWPGRRRSAPPGSCHALPAQGGGGALRGEKDAPARRRKPTGTKAFRTPERLSHSRGAGHFFACASAKRLATASQLTTFHQASR